MEPKITDMQLRRMEDGCEYRSMTMEARADDTDKIVEGYATLFNQPYVLYENEAYKLIEVVDRHAFDGCDMSDVIMQYDHEGRVFARNKNGTLELPIDDVGLKTVAKLGGTDLGNQIYQEIKGGYSTKMSYRYRVAEEKRDTVYDRDNGKTIVTRTIMKIKKLYDVSVVSLPANDMTSISARRFADEVIGEIKAERLERANTARRIKIKLLEA